jgi:phosphate transport system substrate-binding protein
MDNVLKGTYNPLSRPLFLYVSRKSLDKPEVKEFIEFFLTNAAALSTEVKYLPLPATAYELAQTRFRTMQTGTAFGGHPEVGLRVEEILSRPPQS